MAAGYLPNPGATDPDGRQMTAIEAFAGFPREVLR